VAERVRRQAVRPEPDRERLQRYVVRYEMVTLVDWLARLCDRSWAV
jgi:hypothetical protein